MRVDLNHIGKASEEHFSISLIREEGLWAGGWVEPFDTLNLGDYFFILSDAKTNYPLFSRGFNSSFEGDEKWVVSKDCIRFPFPKRSVLLSIRKRNKNNIGFYEVCNEIIDPASPAIDHSSLSLRATSSVIFENGDPENKVDIVILGDGYTISEKAKFLLDAEKATNYLFSVSPYKENKLSFNVRCVFVPSEISGITSPLDNKWPNPVFGSSYNSHNIEREIDLSNTQPMRDAAAIVPYDFIIILVNSNRYGGIGIYNQYSIAAIDSKWAKYLVVHEFGHNFAGLDDEYYTLAKCTQSEKPEPWEPNISSNSKDGLKWRNLVTSNTPIPTSWNKEKYEAFDQDFANKYFRLREEKAPEVTIDSLIEKTLPQAIEILQKGGYSSNVGAFEGASGEACGLFRSQINCTMFMLIPDKFCAACTEAIKRMIKFYTH